MAFDFPNSPTVGQLYTAPTGLVYTWDGEKWGSGSGGGAIYIADSAPAAPVGSLWWESDTGNLYVNYNDGNSIQWVVVVNRNFVNPGHVAGEPGSGAPAAGEVGEAGVTAIVPYTFTSSAVPQNINSIVVPAGDFELMAWMAFAGGGAVTSTNWSSIISALSTPSVATIASITGFTYNNRQTSGAADNMLSHSHMPWRVSNAVPTTYYLHAQSSFAGGSYGGNSIMRYRRAR